VSASPVEASAPALREPFEPRLVRLAGPVAAFWGQGLKVVVRGQTPQFAWDEVRMPVGEALATDDELTCLLLHEWGHRCIAPRTVAQGMWWELIARMEGIAASADAVNLAVDLLVDRWYLEHPSWGGVYAECEHRNLVRTVASELGRKRLRASPFGAFMTACYGEIGGWQGELQGLGLDLGRAARAVRALFDEARSGEERLRGFLREGGKALRGRAAGRPGNGGSLPGGPGLVEPLLGAPAPWRGPTWNPDELVRMIVSTGVRVPSETVAAVAGASAARAVRARLRVLESLLRVTPRVRELVTARRSRRHEGTLLWRAGDPARELEPVTSLERSGLLVPGVTTLRRRGVMRRRHDPDLPDLCLVVDNSGSTAGAVVERELDAAVALLEVARGIGAAVSLVVFGGDVAAAIEPGPRYDDIAMLLAALEGQSGGTSLAPALAQAVAWRPGGGRRMATVIFTDTYVYDLDAAASYLALLTAAGPVVVFAAARRVDSDMGERFGQVRPRPRMVRSDPGEPLVDRALEVLQ